MITLFVIFAVLIVAWIVITTGDLLFNSYNEVLDNLLDLDFRPSYIVEYILYFPGIILLLIFSLIYALARGVVFVIEKVSNYCESKLKEADNKYLENRNK